MLRSLAAIGLGFAGLALGGVPYLAARRILYPTQAEPIPESFEGGVP